MSGESGLRASVVVRLAARSAVRRRTRALVSVAILGLATGIGVGVAGRADAAAATIRDELEQPSARLLRVTDADGQAGITLASLTRLESVNAVSWAAGLGEAGSLVRTMASQTVVSDAVGSRFFVGDFPPFVLANSTSRPPPPGQAVAGARAAKTLGLGDGVGPVHDEELGPLGVIGTVLFSEELDDLNGYVLIAPETSGRSDFPIGEVIILTDASGSIDALASASASVLGVGNPQSIRIKLPPNLSTLRIALDRELSSLNAAVLAVSVIVGAAMVSINVLGAVAERRREFGLRRTQGASRQAIAALIIVEVVGVGSAGIVLGAASSLVIVRLTLGAQIDLALAMAIGAIMLIAALIGSLPPALAAAYRQPIYALR